MIGQSEGSERAARALAAAALLFVAAACGAPTRPAAARRSAIAVHTGGEAPRVEEATLFAFDNASVPFTRNLYIEMSRARRDPANPVLRRGPAGSPDEARAQFNGSVIRHDGKFKMWYIAADRAGIDSMKGNRPGNWRIAYAESTDGVHWVKPNLGLVEYRGSRDNNLVAVDPPDLYGFTLAVLHEPEAPDPGRRFKMMLLVQWDPGDGRRLSTSVPLWSGDGLRWRLGAPARLHDSVVAKEDVVLPPEMFEQGGFYRWQGVYYLTGQQLHPWAWLADGKRVGRTMTIFRSRDLVHWADTRSFSFVRYGYRSAPSGAGEESHLPASVWHRGNVLVALNGLFHGAPGAPDQRKASHPIELGVLLSNDGIQFREPVPDFVFLPLGDKGSWEGGGLLEAQAFENVGGETLVWYGGWDADVYLQEVHADIGLARLRRDGFGALRVKNPAQSGALVTCTLEAAGPVSLWANADGLGTDAWLRVELLDDAEQPLAGYSGKEAAKLDRSGTHVALVWGDSASAAVMRGRFRVRVSFEGAARGDIRLYALYLSSGDGAGR